MNLRDGVEIIIMRNLYLLEFNTFKCGTSNEVHDITSITLRLFLEQLDL